EAAEEFFEYDAEEFLVSLTLLITEGRTPECSVKGRTEGLHCPPAQSGGPVLTKHECSDKLPQCRQARRTRSEIMLLWRNHIPIMIEVMLLPDCCYSDEGLATDLNDPAIKQDALLLERWTLQPVPRQSGDRFIEEKTLLLAVRSYVFFSQLSAWLSASHGIVPRNILYRISPADEELIWNFSQTPSEHAFPVPNVSHSVALKVRVQSLPRQPKYPVLKCSIHSDLSFLNKRSLDPAEGPLVGAYSRGQTVGDPPNPLRLQTSSLLCRPLRSPLPSHDRSSPLNQRKCPESPILPGKATKLLFSRTNGVLESSGKTTNVELPSSSSSPTRNFKSLTNPSFSNPSSSPRSSSVETNPLIGSLLQERQEVIARIAQRLNFCDPTSPHLLPDALFTPPGEEGPYKKTKDPHNLQTNDRTGTRNGEWSQTSLFQTPLSPRSQSRVDRSKPEESRTSPKPTSCRRLLLSPDSKEGSMIVEAVQDISRLIQERLQLSQELLHAKYKQCRESSTPTSSQNQNQTQNHRQNQNQSQTQNQNHQLRANSHTSFANGTVNVANGETSSVFRVQTETLERRTLSENQSQSGLQNKESSITRPQPLTQTSHTYSAKNDPQTSFLNSPKSSHSLNGVAGVNELNHLQDLQDLQFGKENLGRRVETHIQPESIVPGQDEDQDPWSSLSSTPSSLNTQHSPSPDWTLNKAHTKLRSPTSTLKPCSSDWKKQNRHSIDGTATRAFHPCTGLPLLSSPVPQRRSQTGYFDLDTSLIQSKGAPWASSKSLSVCSSVFLRDQKSALHMHSLQPRCSLSAPSVVCLSSVWLCVCVCVSYFPCDYFLHHTLCFILPYYIFLCFLVLQGVINLESLGKRGYRVPPSGTIQVTLFNPNKTVVKMFVVMYDLREMPAGNQTFLRQRTFSVPVKRESNGQNHRKPLPPGQGRTLRYLIHLRFQSSKSGKIYLHRDIRLLFSRKSMEVDSGAAYELKSFTESPADPPFSSRC
ncbi:protein FAM214A isoform X3, partial [Silurus meridionalis]